MYKQAFSWGNVGKLLGSTLAHTGTGAAVGAGAGYLGGDTYAGAQLGTTYGLLNRLGLSRVMKPHHYIGTASGMALGGAREQGANKKGGMLLGSLIGSGVGRGIGHTRYGKSLSSLLKKKPPQNMAATPGIDEALSSNILNAIT